MYGHLCVSTLGAGSGGQGVYLWEPNGTLPSMSSNWDRLTHVYSLRRERSFICQSLSHSSGCYNSQTTAAWWKDHEYLITARADSRQSPPPPYAPIYPRVKYSFHTHHIVDNEHDPIGRHPVSTQDDVTIVASHGRTKVTCSQRCNSPTGRGLSL